MNYPTNDYTTQLRTYRPPFDMDSHKAKRERTIIRWVLTGLAVVVTGVLVFFFTGNTPTTSHALKSPAIVKAVAPKAVVKPVTAKPVTAAQVAKMKNCDEFDNLGDGAALGSTSGVCWVGPTEFDIWAFQTQTERDEWVQAAKSMGYIFEYPTPNSAMAMDPIREQRP